MIFELVGISHEMAECLQPWTIFRLHRMASRPMLLPAMQYLAHRPADFFQLCRGSGSTRSADTAPAWPGVRPPGSVHPQTGLAPEKPAARAFPRRTAWSRFPPSARRFAKSTAVIPVASFSTMPYIQYTFFAQASSTGNCSSLNWLNRLVYSCPIQRFCRTADFDAFALAPRPGPPGCWSCGN